MRAVALLPQGTFCLSLPLHPNFPHQLFKGRWLGLKLQLWRPSLKTVISLDLKGQNQKQGMRIYSYILLCFLYVWVWIWVGWLVGWLLACLLGCLVSWLVGWLLACLLVCLVSWLIGWLVGWLVGW